MKKKKTYLNMFVSTGKIFLHLVDNERDHLVFFGHKDAQGQIADLLLGEALRAGEMDALHVGKGDGVDVVAEHEAVQDLEDVLALVVRVDVGGGLAEGGGQLVLLALGLLD